MLKNLTKRYWVKKNAKRDATTDRGAISRSESPQTAYVKAIVYGYQQESQKVLHKSYGRVKRKYIAARETLDKLSKKQDYRNNLPEAAALEKAMTHYQALIEKKNTTELKLSQIGERQESGSSFFELKTILRDISTEIGKMEQPASSKGTSDVCLQQLRINKSIAETKAEKELSIIERKARKRIRSFERRKQSCLKKLNKEAETSANLLSLYWRKYRSIQWTINLINSFNDACEEAGITIFNELNLFMHETENINEMRKACNLYNSINGRPIL